MSLWESIRQRAPRSLVQLVRDARSLGRRIACDIEDLRDSLTGKVRPLTPPPRMWELVGGSSADFHDVADKLAALVISHGLRPDHRILDIGSGIGRLAVPLTRYLKSARRL